MQTIQSLFLLYIRVLAKLQLLKNRPLIIGITGSEGKTSTKRAVELVLNQRYQVKTSDKANSETGIPLDILGITVKEYSYKSWLKISLLAPIKLLTNWERFDVYLVEMAIDSINEPKNMRYLLKIIKPHIAIITSISAVHGANYIDALTPEERALTSDQIQEKILRIIAKEKGRIVTEMDSPKNVAILNLNNKYIKELKPSIKVRSITISDQERDQPTIQIINKAQNGLDFSVSYKIDNQTFDLILNDKLLGDEYAYTFASAIAVAYALDLPVNQAIDQLKRYTPLPGRFTILNGVNDSTLIDSSYNASPQSMRFALEKLAQLGKSLGKRRIAVLGEMREIGEISAEEHVMLAQFAHDKADLFLLVGNEMREHFLPYLLKLGVLEEKVSWFKNSREVGEALKPTLSENDIVLFKGSQNTIFLEEAVKSVLANERDKEKLCRQSEWWLKEKEKWFNKFLIK